MQEVLRKIEIYNQQEVSTVWRIPDNYKGEVAVILAHGAGNDMNSDLITAMYRYWSDAGMLVIKFNFLYKEKGGKLPDRMIVLIDTWHKVSQIVETDSALAPRTLFYAGKSMGGRVASILAAQRPKPQGIVFLGYPLHPTGNTEKLRTDHFHKISCPMLFIQGTRDPLCNLDILEKVLNEQSLKNHELHLIEGGDHSYRMLKKSGRNPDEVHAEIADRSLRFFRQILDEKSS